MHVIENIQIYEMKFFPRSSYLEVKERGKGTLDTS